MSSWKRQGEKRRHGTAGQARESSASLWREEEEGGGELGRLGYWAGWAAQKREKKGGREEEMGWAGCEVLAQRE